MKLSHSYKTSAYFVYWNFAPLLIFSPLLCAHAKFICASMRFNSFSILRDWRGVSETLVNSIVSQDFWIVPWVQNPSFHHTYQNLDLSSFSPRFSPTQYCSLTKPSTSELFWVLYRFVVKMSYCTIVQAGVLNLVYRGQIFVWPCRRAVWTVASDKHYGLYTFLCHSSARVPLHGADHF